MPTTPTYPGVYIEEVPSGVRTIVGVATSITAFVGRALRGPENEPMRIQSFADFERVFGGLWVDSTMSYAVQHFFLNGGSDALIVRLTNAATTVEFSLAPSAGPSDNLELEASSSGAWGANLRLVVDDVIDPDADPNTVFNLSVIELDPATNQSRQSEVFRNVSVERDAPRYVGTVLKQESALLRLPDPYPATLPTVRPANVGSLDDLSTAAGPTTGGYDGVALVAAQYNGVGTSAAKEGIYALAKADLFNLLCLPPPTRATDMNEAVITDAIQFCRDHRAMMIVDAPSSWRTAAAAVTGLSSFSSSVARDDYAAVYFPRVRMADPLKENRVEEFAPCGVVAGAFARTDAQRGVWKAPAGQEATM
nr:phage tail sheath family protein [Rubrobacteraceae bacterium]